MLKFLLIGDDRLIMSNKQYLELFFEEKEINPTSWEIKGADGTTHFIDSDVVIEAILNCSNNEQAKIADMLRKIDFKNGDVVHYLEHLARGLVVNYV